MAKSKYTGDVAFYATMMTLTEAMKAANYMATRPNKTITDFLGILQRLTEDAVPAAVRARCCSHTFKAAMQNYVAECGLCTMGVLQLLKKIEHC